MMRKLAKPQRRLQKQRGIKAQPRTLSRRRSRPTERGKSPAPFQRRLVIMVKAPIMGRVKTRLAQDLGAVAATMFYRRAVNGIAARVSADPRWKTMLAVTPDHATNSAAWPRGIARIRQGRGDLGRRMTRVMNSLPPGPTVIIGTDVPSLKSADIESAFRAVGSYDAVFGPSPDGGYWLTGLKRRPRLPRAYDNVRWSSLFALNDTIQNLMNFSIARVAVRADVDTASDLKDNAAFASRHIRPAP